MKAFQASPDAIIITSMDGRYIDVNPSFQRLSGYSRDEVIGRTARELDRPGVCPARVGGQCGGIVPHLVHGHQ